MIYRTAAVKQAKTCHYQNCRCEFIFYFLIGKIRVRTICTGSRCEAGTLNYAPGLRIAPGPAVVCRISWL